MYNVIIADDEKNIREGIKELIDWEELGCRVCALVRNGEQVLHYLESGEEAVHIVITDIKMPGMDGMELAGILRDRYPDIKTIILTAYSDFTYAQKAIKCQVADFVVKNDFFSELPRAVGKIVKRWEENGKAHGRTDVFFSESGMCRVCAMETGAVGHGGNRAARKNLEDLLESTFQDKKIEVIEDGSGLLFAVIECKDQPENPGLLVQKFKRFITLADTFQGLKIRAGISMPVKNNECMTLGKKQALRSLSNVYTDDIPAEVMEDWPAHITWSDSEDIDSYMRSLYVALRSEEADAVAKKEEELKECFKDPDRPIEQCRADTYAILSYLFRKTRSLSGKERLAAPESVLDAVYAVRSKAALLEIMRDTCSVFLSVLSDRGKGQNSLVEKADRLIERFYQRKLSLKDISRELYVNSSYLSRVYKKETGHTVTEAVNMYRIKKAKELLETGEYKVGEAGKLVGIEDPAYFTHVFLKYEGRNPSDYTNRQD